MRKHTPGNMRKHTPGKLVQWSANRRQLIAPQDDRGHFKTVAYIPKTSDGDEEANAAHLALCWNCHDEIVSELRYAAEWIRAAVKRNEELMLAALPKRGHGIPQIDAAIAKAEVKP